MNLTRIQNSINTFAETPLREASTRLLNALGYHSERTGNEGIDTQVFQSLREAAAARRAQAPPDALDRLRINDWEKFHLIFQLSDDEINRQETLFEPPNVDSGLMLSYIFVAVQLRGENWTRTQLADITRFINTQIVVPIMVMFRYGDVLTLAIINRRWHKRDETKRVLEKVTLIKDINLRNPHRAHLDILAELHLESLLATEEVRNFDTLHKAWEGVLSTETLNRKFYRELYEWYDWAKSECRFPDGETEQQVIRMITRLLFVWFLKEKGLVPAALFTESTRDALSVPADQEDAYYKAILQNLFFATLNTPIAERAFSTEDNRSHRDASKYRYAALLHEPDAFLEKLKQVPFVNGGLFDCLDTFEATRDGGVRIDCFTDNENDTQKLHVPDKLFFNDEKGIFPLFSRYKFTVEENTPVEQEVALEPELLGRVFENLLGDYNPETQSSARKSTGSYYTPRQIVDYMVDEALIAYFLQKVEPFDGDRDSLEERLRDDLLAYEAQGDADSQTGHLIHESEVTQLIQAIDELKLLDPAVGSGAFPMGILNKLVLVLKKLDPQNEQWKERQRLQARVILDSQVRNYTLDAIEKAFAEENRYNDYGRKLYLIQNSIYGVDIQPIAVTIAKLRFFISLIIEQVANDNPSDNYGIRPLPNLEIRFVAADTLIGLQKSDFQMLLETDAIEQKRQQISKIRENYFSANTRQQKLSLMHEEEACRAELVNALTELSSEWALDSQSGIVDEAQKIAQWNPYDRNAVADFFDAEEMFGVKDGFDIVIGNPPYIRHQKIHHLKPALREQFGDFFTGMADVSVYFYKRAAELLGGGGILIYISTNKFMRAGYGKNLRQFLTSEMSLKALLDFGGISVFEAAVDTCIVLVGKRLPEENHTLRVATLKVDSGTFNVQEAFQTQAFPQQVSHLSPEGWTLEHPETLSLLETLQNTGTPLEQAVDGQFYIGMITGYNDAFIIDTATRQRLIAEDTKSSEVIKPLFRGRDLRKWQAPASDLHLIAIASSANREWPWSMAEDSEAERIFAETYPAIYQHLLVHREALIPRDNQGKFYWELRACAYYADFEKSKIVYRRIAKSLDASYDTKGTFGIGTIYFIPTDDLSLLAILNSTLFDWYTKHKFYTHNDPWAGGGLEFLTQYMKIAPIADRNSEQKAQLSRWVERILAEPTSDKVSALEHAIDQLVYEVYGLTEDDIALIEKTYRDAGMTIPEEEDIPMRIITRDDIQRIGDAESLMQFLRDKLGLPIEVDETLEDTGPRFRPRHLGLRGPVANQFLDCRKLQIFPGDNSEDPEPWVLFLVRFNTDQGYESVLRDICPALEQNAGGSVPFRFICTDADLQPFAFAYFSDSAGGDWANAELTILSWPHENTTIRISYEHELPSVFVFERPVPPDPDPNPTREVLLRKLGEVGTPLRDHASLSSGVHTGLRNAFIIEDAATYERLLNEHPSSADIIKPMVDVPSRKKWRAESKHFIYIPSSKNRRWPWSSALNEGQAEQIFADAYPAIHDYLNRYRDDLKARTQQGEFYWESPSSKRSDLLEHPKIIYPYSRGNSMRACYEESGALVLTPSYFIPTEDLSLLAILNSRLFNWWARSECLAPSGNRLDFKKGIMERFPVADRTEAQKSALAEYVQLILEDPDSHEASALEEEIDALVYNLYGLTDAEIALIEGN